MIPLAIGIAIPDEHARLAGLEIDNAAPFLAAIGTTVRRHIAKMMVHSPPIVDGPGAWDVRILNSGYLQDEARFPYATPNENPSSRQQDAGYDVAIFILEIHRLPRPPLRATILDGRGCLFVIEAMYGSSKEGSYYSGEG
jgi:hypothetical protein